jgi:2-desacetyl-2-hydroxyethyl bacteriochlorophyllide A dehydrogenase
MKARAVEFAAPRRVRLVEVDVPEPEPGQVVVRTERSGISGGTEMLAYRGLLDPDMPLDEAIGALGGTFRYPFRYGYSAVGTVEQSRSSLPEGTRVFAFHPHQDVFVAGADDVVLLHHVGARIGTLLPHVETALQIALDVDVPAGEHVAVVGLGPVGALAAALLARDGGVVVGADPLPWRRDAVAKLGVDAVEPAVLPARVAGATGGRGVPVVVEASGNPDALAAALPLLAHEGVVWVAGWYGTRLVSLPLGAEFHRRRLAIRSTQVSSIPARLAGVWDRSRRREAARVLLEELPLAELATHEFPLEQAARAYDALDRGQEGLVHVALAYG